jgi:hypothetical protein
MPDSSFGILLLTTFISDSHVLPIPASLASRPRRCSELLHVTSRRRIQLDYVVGKASSSVVANERCFPRLPLAAQRVLYRTNMFARLDNDEADMHCALQQRASCFVSHHRRKTTSKFKRYPVSGFRWGHSTWHGRTSARPSESSACNAPTKSVHTHVNAVKIADFP